MVSSSTLVFALLCWLAAIFSLRAVWNSATVGELNYPEQCASNSFAVRPSGLGKGAGYGLFAASPIKQGEPAAFCT